MAKIQINISTEIESKLLLIKSALVKSGKKINNKEELINESINLLHDGMRSSDEETHFALFGVEKTF